MKSEWLVDIQTILKEHGVKNDKLADSLNDYIEDEVFTARQDERKYHENIQ